MISRRVVSRIVVASFFMGVQFHFGTTSVIFPATNLIQAVVIKQQDFGAPDYPDTATWSIFDESTDTITDGNPVEVRVTLVNTTDSILRARLSAVDESSADFELIGDDISIEPDATYTASLLLSTEGYAWLDDGTPRENWQLKVMLTTDDHQVIAEQPTPLKIIPRPLILVNGYNDTHNYWRNHLERGSLNTRVDLVEVLKEEINPAWRVYAIGDGQVEGEIFLGDISRPFLKTDTLQSAGQKLDTYVENVREHANAWQVDIAGHSTGGLVIRAYINNHMHRAPSNGSRVINRVLHFAVPHAGSECADYLHSVINDVTYMYPIRVQLQSQYVTRIFNRYDGANQRGIPYVLIRGSEVNYALKTCLLEPDGIVATASAWAQTPNNPVQGVLDQVPASHYHVADSDFFLEMVQKYLSLSPGDYASLAVKDDDATASPPEAVSPGTTIENVIFLRGEIIQLGSQETVERQVRIPASERAGVALIGKPVHALLRREDTVIAEVSAESGWAPFGIAVLTADASPSDVWTLELENPLDEPTTLQVSTWVKDGVYDLITDTNDIDNAVHIAATLEQDKSRCVGADATVTIVSMGEWEPIEARLNDDGTTGDFQAADGSYELTLETLPPDDYFGTVRVQVDGQEFSMNFIFTVRSE